MNLYKYLLLLCLGFLFACKKEIKQPTVTDPTEDEKVQVSIYDYYNKYSLWTEHIPDRDEADRLAFVRRYSSNENLLSALKNLTPSYRFLPYSSGISPGTHFDRYSFLDESDAGESVSRADGQRMDTSDGYGLYFGWGILEEGATKAYPVIFLVEGGSPAQKAGVTRGTIVHAVNGDEKITVSLTSTGGLNETERLNVDRKLKDALEASSLEMEAENLDGEEVTYTMNYKTYDIDPILVDTIYEYSKNVGYLAYTSFEEVDNSVMGKANREKIDEIITSFEDANVKDLILDLRYNTGGYVSTAEYLADKLINSANDRELMMTYDINDYLSEHKKSDFQDTYFSKKGSLELNNLYVLVTENTASAAELLINVLKPYLNVKLIAEKNRTYGKPVGFFPEEINDDVTLWVTSFKTINADGYTDYWDGMHVDYPNVSDYIFRDFGDPTESMIAKALTLTGATPTSSLRASSQKSGSAQRGVKLGIINHPKGRNMLKK